MTSLEYFSLQNRFSTELAFGELVVRDSPSSSHQAAAGSFFVVLREHVRAHGLGDVWVAPLDVVPDEARALIVQPDLFYVSRDRAEIVKKKIHGAPDLVVGVLSPRRDSAASIGGSIGSRNMASKSAGPITSRNNCWRSSRSQTLG